MPGKNSQKKAQMKKKLVQYMDLASCSMKSSLCPTASMAHSLFAYFSSQVLCVRSQLPSLIIRSYMYRLLNSIRLIKFFNRSPSLIVFFDLATLGTKSLSHRWDMRPNSFGLSRLNLDSHLVTFESIVCQFQTLGFEGLNISSYLSNFTFGV